MALADSDWRRNVEPLAFIKPCGKGRVLQSPLGHGLDSKQNPAYRQLLGRCIEWAATGKVTVE